MLFSDRKQAEKDLLRSLKKGFEGKFRIYLRNLKFGRKNGIFRTEQAKNEGKMQIPYILTDLFWVFLRCFGWKVRDFLEEIKFRNKCTETRLCYSAEKYCEAI